MWLRLMVCIGVRIRGGGRVICLLRSWLKWDLSRIDADYLFFTITTIFKFSSIIVLYLLFYFNSF